MTRSMYANMKISILLLFGSLCFNYHVVFSGPVSSNPLKSQISLQDDVVSQTSLEIDDDAKIILFPLNWVRNEDFPKVTLTPKQQAWFNSLSDSNKNHKVSQKGKRKEIRQLSEEEYHQYVSALWEMKLTFPDPNEDESEYDLFVKIHRYENSPAAHGGAAFLPWHRQFLWRMEQALRSHDPDVSLVYWDSTLDEPLPDTTDSVLWSDVLMGSATEGPVVSGPYTNWSIIPECHFRAGSILSRNANSSRHSINKILHYSDEQLQYYWNYTEFRMFLFPIFNKFEGEHGNLHGYFDGHMSSLFCSPSDPIFWMHHSFVDFIWEVFRQNFQVTDKELEYPTMADQDIGGELHEPYSYMEPFRPLYNIHGLSNHYTNYYYTYEPRSFDCQVDKDCNSDYMWCDATRSRCTSKIRPGGNCTDSPHQSCYGDEIMCIGDICTLQTNPL